MLRLLTLMLLFLLGCKTIPQTNPVEINEKILDTVTVFTDEIEEFPRVSNMRIPPPLIENEEVEETGEIVGDYPNPSRRYDQPERRAIAESGIVSYLIPTRMRVGKVDTVNVKIIRSLERGQIQQLPGEIQASIRTSEVMEVQLIDPTGSFQIIKGNSEAQLVENYEATEWRFYITPIKSGIHPLYLTVSVILNGNRKEKSYVGQVQVQSNPIVIAESFWSSHWKWLLTGLIPLLWGMWKKRKENREKF
jgi:hypothetical protein